MNIKNAALGMFFVLNPRFVGYRIDEWDIISNFVTSIWAYSWVFMDFACVPNLLCKVYFIDPRVKTALSCSPNRTPLKSLDNSHGFGPCNLKAKKKKKKGPR